MNKIKVNIFSPGRFHVCDLARELDKNGFDVKFYSFVPAKRAEEVQLFVIDTYGTFFSFGACAL